MRVLDSRRFMVSMKVSVRIKVSFRVSLRVTVRSQEAPGTECPAVQCFIWRAVFEGA